MKSPSQPRVLCVDDEPGVLRALDGLLRERFDVSSTTDAREALELVRHSAFDVVISDQRMPGMTGTEFLKEVKDLSPHTMRLLLTGYADYAEVLQSVNDSEVFRFVHKPWDNRELMETVTYAATVARQVPMRRPAAHPVDTGAGALVGPIHWRGSDTRTVLLMDKDPATEHQLRTVLGQGMLLLWARSPGEAVSLMHRHKVAVIVLDSRLGTGATLDLIRAVKRNSPNAVTVIHANDGDSTTVSRLINEGQIFRFMAKPATPALIEHTLLAALKKHAELMARPSSIARHAIDISRMAAFARARGDAGERRGTPTPAAAPIRSRSPLSGMAWLRRIFGKI
ncbi:MAG: response regulator [Hydrogenophaga sp.]